MSGINTFITFCLIVGKIITTIQKCRSNSCISGILSHTSIIFHIESSNALEALFLIIIYLAFCYIIRSVGSLESILTSETSIYIIMKRIIVLTISNSCLIQSQWIRCLIFTSNFLFPIWLSGSSEFSCSCYECMRVFFQINYLNNSSTGSTVSTWIIGEIGLSLFRGNSQFVA